MALWFVLTAILSGQFRGIFRRAPWIERYGAALALLWLPLGAWHLLNFYLSAFGG
jgi:hypothetical protein